MKDRNIGFIGLGNLGKNWVLRGSGESVNESA